jgi:hypothetical protein
MDSLSGPVKVQSEHKAKHDNLSSGPMVTKQKINREKIQAALITLCPKCGYAIPPGEIRRIDFEQMTCPQCGGTFTPTKHTGNTV